jgi:hypothetical protein
LRALRDHFLHPAQQVRRLHSLAQPFELRAWTLPPEFVDGINHRDVEA